MRHLLHVSPLVLFTACGDVAIHYDGSSSGSTHACEAYFESNYVPPSSEGPLVFIHTEPRRCPVQVSYMEDMQTSGVFIDPDQFWEYAEGFVYAGYSSSNTVGNAYEYPTLGCEELVNGQYDYCSVFQISMTYTCCTDWMYTYIDRVTYQLFRPTNNPPAGLIAGPKATVWIDYTHPPWGNN